MEVVQVLEAGTGADFVLMGDKRWAKQLVFAQADDEYFEEALARILRDYSYALSQVDGSKMPKVTIVLQEVMGKSQLNSALSDVGDRPDTVWPAGDPVVTDDQAFVNSSSSDFKKEEDSLKEVYVPYDLDDYAALPEKELGIAAEQGSEAGLLSAEEQAALEEWRNQARLERSLSALKSKYTHLRSMAIEELVGIKDPRATNALESAANSGDASDLERSQAAQALWHHAADLEFADPVANEALKRLVSNGGPEVRAVAERALIDMERYQRRYGR
jgi:hypothetical protein